jgi:nucleotide-binding universal stress UspA family protein
MRVLIATDGSDISLAAARAAAELVRADAEMALVTAVPAVSSDTGAGGIEGPDATPEELAEMQQESQVAGETALTQTAAELGLVGAQQHVVEGEPGPALCNAATDLGADVLVVGSHGRGVIARTLLGSVSDYVVHHAPCPVLVVR